MNATVSDASSNLSHSEQPVAPALTSQQPLQRPQSSTNALVNLELEAYRNALDQVSMVVITDAAGIITYANELLCQASQYQRAELEGQSFQILSVGQQTQALIEQIYETVSNCKIWQGEMHCNRKDGSYYWAEVTVIPFLDQAGKPYQYLSIRNDITQRKQAEAVLQQEHERLKFQFNRGQEVQARLDSSNHVLELIANRAPLPQILTEIALTTEILSGEALCHVMKVDHQRGTLVSQASPSLPRDFIRQLDGQPSTAKADISAAAVSGHCVVIVPDSNEPHSAPEHGQELAGAHGLQACWARPVFSQGRVVAVMSMYYPKPQWPSETDRVLMEHGVELIQIALERHAAEAALKEQLQQQRLLRAITRDIRQSLDPTQIFHMAVTRVRKLLQVDRVSILRCGTTAALSDGECVAEDVQEDYITTLGTPIEAMYGFEEILMTPDKHRENLVAVDDIQTSGLSSQTLATLKSMQVRAMVMVPLLIHQGSWGLLCIHQCSGSRQWQPLELDFIEEITEHLSVALQQAELLGEAKKKSFKLTQLLATVQLQKEQHSRKAQRERGLSRVIQQIRQSLDFAKIAKAATEEARKVLECDRVLIYRFLPDWSGDIVYESVTEGSPNLMINHQPFRWVDSYLQQHRGGRFRARKPLVIADIHRSDYSDCSIATLEERGIRALMIVPIFTGDQLWGLMGAYQSHEIRDWKSFELGFLDRISDQLGVAFQQSALMSQLQLAKEKAEAANHAKSTFLANMSHELRTPLNAILGFSQLMQRESNFSPPQREKLGIINRSGAHLLSLINDVLEMSKIEAGRTTLNENDFDLYLLCDSIHELFRLKAEAKGIALTMERDPDLPQYVRGDEGKLRQVLINLVSNSLKFTATGEIGLKLWRGETVPLDPIASLSNAPVRIHFTVRDSGQGIASNELSRLFDAFYQTEVGRQSQEGTGLGLPISRKFAELMGGEMVVTSQLHQGTSVSFSVLVPPVIGKMPREQATQRVIGLGADQPNYRILIVEDHAANRMLLTQLLQAVGFSVRTADNGKQAIAQWQDWQPHLIWMDLQMPIMDGFEATRQIRRLEAERRRVAPASQGDCPTASTQQPTFILALTASVFEQTRIETLGSGLNDFIYKPFQEHILFDKMAQYLNLDYCYEAVQEASVQGSSPQGSAESCCSSPEEQVLTLHQQLGQMEADWKQRLYDAATTLDEAAVLEQIEAIDEHHSALAQGLLTWLKALRLDKIVTLLQGEQKGSIET